MEDVPVDDLQQCLNCLVSIEKLDEGEIYQGRVEQVLAELNTIVLTRPFKTGRPMTPTKFPLFISPKDVVKIIEYPQKPAPTKSKEEVNKRLREMNLGNKTPQKAKQEPRSYTALELLNRAQQSRSQNGVSTKLSPVPVAESNIQLLQRLQPQQSEPTASKQTIQVAQSNNGGGPSGNPIMDLLSGHVRRGKHEFDQPINMDELKEDFDFCGNLALFQKKDSKSEDGYLEGADELADMQPDDEDGDYYRVVYEDKTAPNFRHDENILSDPKRVTSWVNKTANKTKQFVQQQQSIPTSILTPGMNKKCNAMASPSTSTPSKTRAKVVQQSQKPVENNGTVDLHSSLKLKTNNSLPTDNGAILPILRKSDKQNLLAATVRLFNESMYSCIVADRFTEYAFDLQRRLFLNFKQILVIAGSECDVVLLHRFTQYFYNRDYKIHVYDPPTMPGVLGSNVVEYRDVDDLPTNFPAVYFLSAQTFHVDEDLRHWILRIARPAQISNASYGYPQKQSSKVYPRIVALDFRLFDVKHMHTLYLGAADDTVNMQGRIRDNSVDPVVCTFEAVVADLGTPFSWVSCSESTPADAFRNSLLCRLSIN